MFWYPTENGYVNLERALYIDVEQFGIKFNIAVRLSLDPKDKIVLKTFNTKEEATQLLDWLMKEMNKQKD